MKLLFSAGVIVYFKRREKVEYLLLQYAQGHWGFAKGKIEEGESKQEAALRELKEEAGQIADIHDGFEKSFEYFFKDEDGDLVKKQVTFFVGKSKSKHVSLSHEHIGYGWLEYDDAMERLTYDNAKKVLAQADAFIAKQ